MEASETRMKAKGPLSPGKIHVRTRPPFKDTYESQDNTASIFPVHLHLFMLSTTYILCYIYSSVLQPLYLTDHFVWIKMLSHIFQGLILMDFIIKDI